MTDLQRKRKLRLLYSMNAICFGSFMALKVLVVLGVFLSFFVNHLLLKAPKPVLRLPPVLFYFLTACWLLSSFYLLSHLGNKKWKAENKTLTELIQKEENRAPRGTWEHWQPREDFLDRMTPMLRHSLSAYTYLFLRDRYRQLAGILKFSLPRDTVFLAIFLVIPLTFGSLSIGQQMVNTVSESSWGISVREDRQRREEASAEKKAEKQAAAEKKAAAVQEYGKISTGKAMDRLAPLYRPHCKQLTRYHSGGIISGLWKKSQLYGHTTGILEPGDFEATVVFKNRYNGEVTQVTYSLEMDDGLTPEENLDRFQEQVELFHGFFLEAHLPGLSGGTEGEIVFPDTFRRQLLRNEGKDDVYIHETDDLDISFSCHVNSNGNSRLYLTIHY